MTAIPETISATDSGDNCCCSNWADSRHGGDFLAQSRAIHERANPAFCHGYFLFQSAQMLNKRHADRQKLVSSPCVVVLLYPRATIDCPVPTLVLVNGLSRFAGKLARP
ncbi:hypothetical protein, partial [Paraburkholderia mimosarum]